VNDAAHETARGAAPYGDNNVEANKGNPPTKATVET
jgi:hypothetical protein